MKNRPPGKMMQKLARSKTRYRQWHPIKKALIILLGVIITLLAIVIAPLPGPGPVFLLPIGLFLLALQFSFAERLLERAENASLEAREKFKNMSRAKQILSVIAFLGAIAGIIVVVLLWDIPILPDS